MYETDMKEIKIILLGESGTGKSNLVNICCNLKFNLDTISNISSSILEKKIMISGVQYNLIFWDTAGQEKYRSLNNIFIKDSKIVIFVYDVTDLNSFEALNYWVNAVEEILGKKIVCAVVGNKSDLLERVKREDGEKFAEKLGAFFIQTSAKDDKGEFSSFVDKLVNEFLVKNNMKGWEILPQEERISLSSSRKPKKKKRKFC